jgi:serine/threonine-protein kinase
MRRIHGLIAVMIALKCVTASAAVLPEFPPNAVWSRDVSQAPLNPDSSEMISATGGWGSGDRFRIDQSMYVLHVSAQDEASVPMVDVVAGPYGYTDPDCEPRTDLKFPLPNGGAIEGSDDYSCANDSDDCHLFVVMDGSQKLYESYGSSVNGSGQLESACVIVWDLNKVYPPQGRGEQCTSADAAGFPMASLLFNADEVYAASQVTNGDIGHAIRFILPNDHMAPDVYVHPASHAGGPDGTAAMIPYGSRLRLKASFNVDAFSSNVAARVILRTMQRYGIVLSDGGNIALTAENDRFTTHKWAEFGFDEIDTYMEEMVEDVNLSDFEVVETGPQIPLTYDCDTGGNKLVPKDFIFIDPFDY